MVKKNKYKWDGMLNTCKSCGKILGDNPAEIYAGTYTGLCYSCERGKSFVIKKYINGGKLISYPPHCPSWRRDRELYTGYDDCSICSGAGRIYHSKSNTQGGSYYSQCMECLNKRLSRKIRKN